MSDTISTFEAAIETFREAFEAFLTRFYAEMGLPPEETDRSLGPEARIRRYKAVMLRAVESQIDGETVHEVILLHEDRVGAVATFPTRYADFGEAQLRATFFNRMIEVLWTQAARDLNEKAERRAVN